MRVNLQAARAGFTAGIVPRPFGGGVPSPKPAEDKNLAGVSRDNGTAVVQISYPETKIPNRPFTHASLRETY